MENKKLLLSIFIFAVFMIITSLIKTETRLIEKKIEIYQKKISNLKSNIHEAQLDYFYLTSPEYISNKIIEHATEEYLPIDFSRIYLSLDEFIEERKKTTQIFDNEKKEEQD